MKILHLTDIHFDGKPSNQLREMTIKLIDLLENEKIDYFVFSGDLVSDPKNVTLFQDAKKFLIDPILSKLNISEENFFICEGNHDVQRNQELPIIQETFKNFKKVSEIEDFITVQKGEQLTASLKNHVLYIEFLKSIKFSTNDILNPLYTIHKRFNNGQAVNIVTINSAWRALSSKTDPGNLFFPISILNSILENIDNKSIKILIMHHPLREFKEFVSREMEDIIFDNFHIMLTGHLHKKNNSLHFANDVGIFCSSSQATFSKNDEGIELGFSILDFDNHYLDFRLINYFYVPKDRKFYSKPVIQSKLPLDAEKEEQNKLRKTFRKRFEEGKLKADELLLSNEEKSSFLELFVEPVICDKPRTQANGSFQHLQLVQLESDDKNYLIFGKDKCGKTSILYKIYLDLLDTFTDMKVIPLYIDLKLYKNTGENFDIFRTLTVFCETSVSKMEMFCKKYKIKILIDNYTSDNVYLNNQFIKLIEVCSSISLVATIEETLLSGYQNHKLNSHKFQHLFIHEIGRPQVRSLTNKWPAMKDDLKEETIETISKMFSQLSIPYNYWTVSLFLWVFNKTKESNFHNNFELIQLYIDGLLERKRHIIDKGIKISFEDLKEYLAFLAYKLVTEHYETSHSVLFSELAIITDEYRSINRRIVIESSDLIELIIDRGIIKKLDEDRFTFRLNGVFEYFIAFYMKDDKAFTFKLIKDDSFYLSFANEFELYSGFNRKDKEFMEAIFLKTSRIFESINEKYLAEGDSDNNLVKRVIDIENVTKELSNIKEKSNLILNYEEQDDLISDILPIDKSTGGVTKKKFFPKIEETSDHLEKALFILCRVFRNSNIDSPDLDKKVLDYIIDSTCNLGFTLIDETKNEITKDDKITSREKHLIKLVMDLMPMIIQTFLFEALAQNNLERLLKEKLFDLKKSPKINQFKLFIVYYLLIDLDFKNNRHMITELMSDIKLGVLKHSNLVKLYLYLAFKTYNKKELSEEIQGYIRTQEKLIDSSKGKTDHVNQKIERTKKFGQVRRERK